MIKTLFFYILFLLSFILNSIEACEIISYSRIIRPEKINLNFKDVVKKSNCKSATKLKFVKAIQTSKGLLSSRMLQKEFAIKADILPRKIRIEILEEVLINNYDLSNRWAFQKTHAVGQPAIILLSANESLSFECALCTRAGDKSIKVYIHDAIKGSKRLKWIKSTLMTRTFALISVADFHVNNKPLSLTQFTVKEVFSKHPESFFTNKEKLRFYKLNKILRKNTAINHSDLSPVSLVKNGQAVTIELKNETLSLFGKAIPLKNAFFGETLQLRNLKSNKVIIGKVVDYNKVVVEL
jgi:flagella basal body P-ring formation protein FlgA